MSLTEFEKILDRYNKGICTVEEKRWLENWIKNNQLFQKNKWEYLSTEEKESILQQLFHRIDAHIQTTEVAEDIVQGVPLWRSRLAWWSVAMLIAILSVSVYMYSLRKESQKNLLTEIQWLHLEVSQGERKKIKLSDGTVIWLQGGSRLSYPHTFAGSDNRTVKFEGEGYFEVENNEQQPFIVESKHLKAEVLGTSFNVQVYEGLPRQAITLIEGELLVSLITNAQEQSTLEQLPTHQIHLFPEQTASLELPTLLLTKVEEAYSRADDFKAGNLQFDETALSEVLYRVAQKYGVHIEFDAHLADRHKISAVYYITDPVQEVIRSIAESTGSGYHWKNEKQVVFTP